ncbi:MAG: S1C family serine protease [Acidimicrobiales bacterium]
MGVTEELAGAAKNVVERVGPAVVRVGRGGGRGCGVVVAPGRVLTNAHNLRGDEITVTFADGREVVGIVTGHDIDGDLAVISVETGEAPAVDWASDGLATGDVVFAMARSAAGGVRVSFGLVSATERSFRGPRGRQIKGSLEHTAPLPRGSSGGPVVDAAGGLVGINTNRLGDGFYLALPADADLRARIDDLAAGRSRHAPRLGVGLAPPFVARKLRRAVGLPEQDGLLVRVVEEDSPAAKAGIRQGDLITAAAGRPLTSVDDLFAALDAAAADRGIELTVVRGVDELSLHVSFNGDGGNEEGSA